MQTNAPALVRTPSRFIENFSRPPSPNLTQVLSRPTSPTPHSGIDSFVTASATSSGISAATARPILEPDPQADTTPPLWRRIVNLCMCCVKVPAMD